MLIRNSHLIWAAALAIGIGIVLRLVAEEWSMIEYTTADGGQAGSVNHSRKMAFEWVALVLNYGGLGTLAYALYQRREAKKKGLRI